MNEKLIVQWNYQTREAPNLILLRKFQEGFVYIVLIKLMFILIFVEFSMTWNYFYLGKNHFIVTDISQKILILYFYQDRTSCNFDCIYLRRRQQIRGILITNLKILFPVLKLRSIIETGREISSDKRQVVEWVIHHFQIHNENCFDCSKHKANWSSSCFFNPKILFNSIL